MRKRATEGTKMNTSLSMTKNTVSTRSRAERLRIAVPSLYRPPSGGPLPRARSIRRRELPFVRLHLLLVIVAIAPVDKLVAGERRGIELSFGRGDQVEMPAGVLAANQPCAHPHRAGEAAMCRDVADAEPDPPGIGSVRRRAGSAPRGM